MVQIIDREGDSVGELRQWEENNHLYLVRAKARPTVEYQNQRLPLGDVAKQLTFTTSGEVIIQDQPAPLLLAETEITLTRPAQRQRCRAGKTILKQSIKGKPLSLRLVATQIVDQQGKLISEWLLLSNVRDTTVDAKKLSQWYYWRWKIESFFKLLKQVGHQLESWQQTTGEAIAKRLLVASMACIVTWQLLSSDQHDAKEVNDFLIKLSGRQMKHHCSVTAPALLAGLWCFLSWLEVLAQYSLDDLLEMRDKLVSCAPLLSRIMRIHQGYG